MSRPANGAPPVEEKVTKHLVAAEFIQARAGAVAERERGRCEAAESTHHIANCQVSTSLVLPAVACLWVSKAEILGSLGRSRFPKIGSCFVPFRFVSFPPKFGRKSTAISAEGLSGVLSLGRGNSVMVTRGERPQIRVSVKEVLVTSTSPAQRKRNGGVEGIEAKKEYRISSMEGAEEVATGKKGSKPSTTSRVFTTAPGT